MNTLQAIDLRKGFGSGAKRVEAVQGVSLTIAPGTILAFLGPNGAGKSTTIKMIAGLLLPDSGSVLIEGLDPNKSRSVFARVGIVLEGSRNVYQQLSARENLEYFGVVKGLSESDARTRAQELLRYFKLEGKTDSRVRELSSGMQQKLTIAVALMNRPRLLLLDEPTNALDVEAAEDIKQLMRQLTADGLAILLTTHQLDVAQQVADRTAIIRNGKIMIETDTEELIKQFAGESYKVTFQGELSSAQSQSLSQLGVAQEVGCLRFHGDDQLVYAVLGALKPNAITQLSRGESDLSSVFLKLMKEEGKMLTLFRAEMKRQWAMIKAYPVDQIGSIIILAFVFYMLFLGAKYIAGPSFHLGDRVDSIFVGYVSWLLMMTTYQSVSSSIRDESTQGTLLQLLTSPFSARAILFLRTMAGAVTDLVTMFLVTVSIMLITGIRISLTPAVLPFVFTAILAATGLGFILGGITLLYKKANMVMNIVQYAILFGVMAPVESWGKLGIALSVLVPTGPSAAGLRAETVGHHFSSMFLMIALVNVLLYLGGGLVLFGWAEQRARKRGLLGAF